MIWFGYIVAYPSGEEGGILLIQMISTCLRYAYRKGGGACQRRNDLIAIISLNISDIYMFTVFTVFLMLTLQGNLVF
jgi:hypothetical protein